MITVICSSQHNLNKFEKHIRKTSGIGKELEFIGYENNGEFSLSEIYSKGLEVAKYNNIVFLHDDITLESKDWGKKLLKHFDTSDYGILGLAGTTGLTDSGRWWDQLNLLLGVVNHEHEGKSWTTKYSSSFGNRILQALVVDGLFFAVRKDRLKYDFNTDVRGFHFYDVDFTFGNHVNGCKVGVIFDVRVTHKSIGETNEAWEENRKLFVEKWLHKLPTELKGEIFYNDKKINIKHENKIDIIIPTKGNVDMLIDCVNSIYKHTDYVNFVVNIADTGSTPEELDIIANFIESYSGERKINLIQYNYYNFAKINNDVVKNHLSSDSELLLFCNNDIVLINDAISNLVKVYQQNKNNVGTLGARLHFENNRIQHAGILSYINERNGLEFTHIGLQTNYRYHELSEVIGNTAAFLMINKELFNIIGGFNENYIECFEDVELNLQCLLLNKKNLFVGNAVCYHYESVSRGKTNEAKARLIKDYNERLKPFVDKHYQMKLHKYIKKTRQ